MPSTEQSAAEPVGIATEAPPILGFILFISAFAVLYWIAREWFVRLDREP